MLNQERLIRRVDGRNQAKAIIDLLLLDHPDKIAAFFDELDSTFRPKTEEQKTTDQRTIRQLAEKTLEFGAYVNKQFDEIPRDYLEWLLSSSEDLTQDLRAYLDATVDRSGEDDE